MSSYTETRVDVAEFEELRLGDAFPLPIDDMSLAHQLGIHGKTLWWAIGAKDKLYKTFKMPKRGKAGRYREIQNPADKLKDIQKNILVRFLELIAVGKHVGAYIPHRGCKDTAVQHVGQAVIISLDLEDFFPSVRRSMIRKYLHKAIGYNHLVSSLLADLMTYTYFVPQGAPTSGLISNLVADYLFDQKILEELSKRDPKWVYTRYSDDIDISHPETQPDEKLLEIIEMVRATTRRAGFLLNQAKTKIEPKWDRQKVLGMVVNTKVNIPRLEYERVRSIIHNCFVHGFDNQYERAELSSVAGLKSHIRGKLAYYKNIDPIKTQRLKDKFDLACQIHHKPNMAENEVRFDE